MKTKLLIWFSVIFIVNFTIFSTIAQETSSKKRGNLDIGIGINTYGPAPNMSKLMKIYNFDYTTDNWMSGGTVSHPHYVSVGGSFQISYSNHINTKSQIGFMINRALLREVLGAHATGRYLFVRFSNTSLVPFFRYELMENLELQVGPALMINSGDKTSDMPNQGSEDYNTLSPGVLSGLNLKIWDRRVTYSKFCIQYLLTTKNKMGPYTANLSSSAFIPESKIGFSFINIIFVMGFHL